MSSASSASSSVAPATTPTELFSQHLGNCSAKVLRLLLVRAAVENKQSLSSILEVFNLDEKSVASCEDQIILLTNTARLMDEETLAFLTLQIALKHKPILLWYLQQKNFTNATPPRPDETTQPHFPVWPFFSSPFLQASTPPNRANGPQAHTPFIHVQTTPLADPRKPDEEEPEDASSSSTSKSKEKRKRDTKASSNDESSSSDEDSKTKSAKKRRTTTTKSKSTEDKKKKKEDRPSSDDEDKKKAASTTNTDENKSDSNSDSESDEELELCAIAVKDKNKKFFSDEQLYVSLPDTQQVFKSVSRTQIGNIWKKSQNINPSRLPRLSIGGAQLIKLKKKYAELGYPSSVFKKAMQWFPLDIIQAYLRRAQQQKNPPAYRFDLNTKEHVIPVLKVEVQISSDHEVTEMEILETAPRREHHSDSSDNEASKNGKQTKTTTPTKSPSASSSSAPKQSPRTSTTTNKPSTSSSSSSSTTPASTKRKKRNRVALTKEEKEELEEKERAAAQAKTKMEEDDAEEGNEEPVSQESAPTNGADAIQVVEAHDTEDSNSAPSPVKNI